MTQKSAHKSGRMGRDPALPDPEDLAARYLAVIRALRMGRWFITVPEFYRAAALTITGPGLVNQDGTPETIARDIHRTADALRAVLPVWSGLKGEVRIPIAAFLLTHGVAPDDVPELRRKALELFREERLSYVEPYGFLTALILATQPGLGGLTTPAVRRVKASSQLLRARFWLAYYEDVAPLVATNAGGADSPEQFTGRVRQVTQGLRDAGFRDYSNRLRAALLITAGARDTKAVVSAMAAWRMSLKGSQLPHKLVNLTTGALVTMAWGRPDPAYLDAISVLYEDLREGRPRANRRTAINDALMLFARSAATGEEAQPRGIAQGMLATLAGAQLVSNAAYAGLLATIGASSEGTEGD